MNRTIRAPVQSHTVDSLNLVTIDPNPMSLLIIDLTQNFSIDFRLEGIKYRFLFTVSPVVVHVKFNTCCLLDEPGGPR